MALAIALAAPPAGAAYRCTDEKGVTHFGDTPPPQCAKVRLYQLNSAGVAIRVIEPSLTPEQATAREREAAQAREAERLAAEARRRDNALLATYTTEKEFDLALERDLKVIEARMAGSRDRVTVIDARQAEIVSELEFYAEGRGRSSGKRREPPPDLVAEQERLREEKSRLGKTLERDQATIADLRSRTERDRRRWLELTQGGRQPPGAGAPRN